MLHMELPALPATADANRIEGWTRYHDYFHRIERVMQVSWSACRAAAHHARPTIIYYTPPDVALRCTPSQRTTDLAAQRRSSLGASHALPALGTSKEAVACFGARPTCLTSQPSSS